MNCEVNRLAYSSVVRTLQFRRKVKVLCMSRKDKRKNSTEDGFGAICKDMGTGEVIIDMCKLMCKEEQL